MRQQARIHPPKAHLMRHREPHGRAIQLSNDVPTLRSNWMTSTCILFFFNHQLHGVIPLLTSYIVSHLALLPHYSLDICEHPQGNHSACLSQSFWIVKCLPISTTEDPRRRFFWSSLMYPTVPLGYIITTPLCHLLVSCLSEGNQCVFNCPHFTQGIFQG